MALACDIHSHYGGARSMDDPGERSVLQPEEAPTSDITAAPLNPAEVAPSSAFLESLTQPSQPALVSVTGDNLPPLPSSGLTSKLEPEENEDPSSYHMWTRQQSRSQGIAGKTASDASSSRPPPANSPDAPKAMTVDSVSCRQPQQETGHPPSPKYIPLLPSGAPGLPQFTAEAVSCSKELPAPRESNRGAMPVNPVTTQGSIYPSTSIPPGGQSLSSMMDDRSKSYRSPVQDNDGSVSVSLYNLQISKASSCDGWTFLETETAISVSSPNGRSPSQDHQCAQNGACPSPKVTSLWHKDTLEEFDCLCDFTLEEARSLSVMFGIHKVKVKEFMLAFQELDGALEKLHGLAEKLKDQRSDVVKAMHGQPSLLQHLGPLLPETHSIAKMKHSLRHEFTTALSIRQPTGHDWQRLADKLNVSPIYIRNWEQRNPNPAETLLTDWQSKISEATVGTLFKLMIDMGREDLAAML